MEIWVNANIWIINPKALQFFLTWGTEEQKHGDPVNPEEHEAEEGPERLQDQQWEVDEHFARHVEQGDGESHALSHEKHHQQEHNLQSYTTASFSQLPVNTGYMFADRLGVRPTLSCINPVQLQPSCTQTYRKNGRTNGVHKQSLDVVWSHFLPKHRGAVIIQGVFVVGVQPPEDTGPTWKKRKPNPIYKCSVRENKLKTEWIVTYRSNDHQNCEDPNQQFGDVTDDNHHDQGEDWVRGGGGNIH